MATKRVKRPMCAAKFCHRPQIKYSVYCREHARVRGKCAVIGCENPAIPQNNGACAEHNKLPTLPAVLTALCAAVAAKYRAEGDMTKAGIVVAELSHDPPRFYASVARYPDGPMGKKQIVAQVGRSFGEVISTAEDAVDMLAQKFAGENRPAQVRQRLEELDAVLGLADDDDFSMGDHEGTEGDRG